jgi:DUF3093 family protein
MRVYHERLRVPTSWWLIGLVAALLLATEVVAGFGLLISAVIYLVICGGLAAMLLSWGRASIEVAGGELRAGAGRLPLSATGEVAALDAAQTQAMRGPRADPAAFLLLRPYLRAAVYVEVTGEWRRAARQRGRWLGRRAPSPAEPGVAGPGVAGPGAAGPGVTGHGMGESGANGTGETGQRVPYWLIATRNPAGLAAAITSARAAAAVDEPRVG